MGQRLCGEQLPAAASAERPSLALPVAREKPNTWLGKRFLSKRDEEKKRFKKKRTNTKRTRCRVHRVVTQRNASAQLGVCRLQQSMGTDSRRWGCLKAVVLLNTLYCETTTKII